MSRSESGSKLMQNNNLRRVSGRGWAGYGRERPRPSPPARAARAACRRTGRSRP